MKSRSITWACAGVVAVGLIFVTGETAQAGHPRQFGLQIGGLSVQVGHGGAHLSYPGSRYPAYRYGYGHSGHHRGHYDWHDTSHYDWHPGYYQRHGNHFDYTPGHYDFHGSGHYDYHRGGHHPGHGHYRRH